MGRSQILAICHIHFCNRIVKEKCFSINEQCYNESVLWAVQQDEAGYKLAVILGAATQQAVTRSCASYHVLQLAKHIVQ